MKLKIFLITFVLLNISCSSQNKKQLTPAGFLKESYSARDYLKRSFVSVPEGASLKTSTDAVNVIDANWPSKILIKSVDKKQPWRSRWHYHFVLGLDGMNFANFSQTGSYSMNASILLDYYFSGLADIGYKEAGDPFMMIFYPTQFAGKTWFNKECNIIITGNVYINVEYKNAMVSADVIEVFQK
jgi:hypothetical protein